MAVRHFRRANTKPDIFSSGYTRRRVHINFAFAFCYIRMIHMARHSSVRNIPGIVIGRPVAMNNQFAVGRHGCKCGVSIAGVGNLNAIDIKMISVHIGFQRPDGECPDSVVAFCKRQRLSAQVIGCINCSCCQHHLLRIGRFQREKLRYGRRALRANSRGTERIQSFGIFLRIVIEIDIGLLRPYSKWHCQKKSNDINQMFFHKSILFISLLVLFLFKNPRCKIMQRFPPNLPFMVAGERIELNFEPTFLHGFHGFFCVFNTHILLATRDVKQIEFFVELSRFGEQSGNFLFGIEPVSRGF
jgi:hypothetical protein